MYIHPYKDTGLKKQFSLFSKTDRVTLYCSALLIAMSERSFANIRSIDLDDDGEEDVRSDIYEQVNAARNNKLIPKNENKSQQFQVFNRYKKREIDAKVSHLDMSDSINFTKSLYDRNQLILKKEKSDSDDSLARRSHQLMQETEYHRESLEIDRRRRQMEYQHDDEVRSNMLLNCERSLNRLEKEGQLLRQESVESRELRRNEIAASEQRHRDNNSEFLKTVAVMDQMALINTETRNIQMANHSRRMYETELDATHERNKLEAARMDNIVRSKQTFNLQEQQNLQIQERIRSEGIAQREAERRQTNKDEIEKVKLWNEYEDKLANNPNRRRRR